MDKVSGKISIRFYGNGYYTFHFEIRADKDLIFRNGPYFMDSGGLYLNKWTPDFDPELDVPSAVPVWVRLLHLPLHCWGDDSVRAIGNAVGKYIDRSEPKDNMQACARICVEVDLGKGLPEAIKLKVDDWTHIQQLDYEQIPFKCKVCHEYGHFANQCSKITNDVNVQPEKQWETVKRKKVATAPLAETQPKSAPFKPNPNPYSSTTPPPSPPKKSLESSNPFSSISLDDDPPITLPPSQDESLTPASPANPSPSFSHDPPLARTTRSSSKEHGANLDTHKKQGLGRRSTKQQREENAQKDIAMGTQNPIETYILGQNN